MKIDAVIILLLIIVVIIASASLFILDHAPLAIAIDIGFITSLVYILIGFFSIYRSFGKPSTIFYRSFFGGLAIRFLLFLATLFILYKFSSISVSIFTLSFIAFYVVLQGLEIRYVWQKLENQKLK